jgi:hypothetical protein
MERGFINFRAGKKSQKTSYVVSVGLIFMYADQLDGVHASRNPNALLEFDMFKLHWYVQRYICTYM